MCVCCKEKNFIRNSISSLFFKFLFFFFSRHIEIPIAAAGEGGGFFFNSTLPVTSRNSYPFRCYAWAFAEGIPSENYPAG